jgi:hypothetical protein
MGDNQQPDSNSELKRSEAEKNIKHEINLRIFRALNYGSIFLFILVVYSSALLTDYILFSFITWLLKDDVQSYPIVALWFDYARIGIALMLIILAVVHAIISTYTQIKLDIKLSKEGDIEK